jgi:thiopeptide-type bacteriocin biosynthesis protein
VSNRFGQLPGAPDAPWLFAKIYTHPERMNDVLTTLPNELGSALAGDPPWWFIRYRSDHESDHVRLRVRTSSHRLGQHVAAIGAWAHSLRERGISGRLAFDTYDPEVGRYGSGPAMDAAETVFAADSQLVISQLQHLAGPFTTPTGLVALNLIAIVAAFLGDHDAAMRWLADRPVVAPKKTPDRAITDQVIRLARTDMLAQTSRELPQMADAWHARNQALAFYASQIPRNEADPDVALESLLHIHHIRAIGLDRDHERGCRRLARLFAVAYRADESVVKDADAGSGFWAVG